MHQLEFFFDCSSPWTYLAFESIQSIASRDDVKLIYRPILVGGLFNTINPSVYESRTNPVVAKANYHQKDLQDWAASVGVIIGAPPVFPVNSVKAMRGVYLAEQAGCLVPYVRRVFQAYWTELRDIAQVEVLRQVIAPLPLDEEAFFAGIDSDAIRQRLKDDTGELARRGGFGSPTMFLDADDMYFGNDRIPLIKSKLDKLSA